MNYRILLYFHLNIDHHLYHSNAENTETNTKSNRSRIFSLCSEWYKPIMLSSFSSWYKRSVLFDRSIQNKTKSCENQSIFFVVHVHIKTLIDWKFKWNIDRSVHHLANKFRFSSILTTSNQLTIRLTVSKNHFVDSLDGNLYSI